jgi:hypothetical protein
MSGGSSRAGVEAAECSRGVLIVEPTVGVVKSLPPSVCLPLCFKGGGRRSTLASEALVSNTGRLRDLSGVSGEDGCCTAGGSAGVVGSGP